MVNIREVVQSGNAITATQGALLLRAMRYSKTKVIVLDFSELESCNTQFVNESIGKYFMQENHKEVQFRGVAEVWKWKVDKAIEFATNKELRDFHNGLLERLINNQQQLDTEIQEMVSNNFWDLINE